MKSALLSAVLLLLPSAAALADSATFTNPIAEGADPWVTKHGDQYVWCFSEGNRGISVWLSDRLTSIGTRHVVWQAPETGPWSKEVWAPEMHFLDGKWYIYLAADDGNNANHLAYVLESKNADPLGPYQISGPFATGDGADGKSPNIWAIDMTVLEHGGKRYAIWSGWDKPGTDRQFLYIAPMKNPRELAAPRRLLVSNDNYLWERTEEREGSRGLNEGPQILKRDGRTFVTYSCGASWSATYKLGLLELTGADPSDPASWKKHPEPVFKSGNGVIGVGHSTFVPSPDGSEIWHVYHAKVDDRSGWRRAVSVQPVSFKADGFPDFGTPVRTGTPQPVPAGQKTPEVRLPLALKLHTAADLKGFSYFGHQQFLATAKDGVDLGVVPQHPVNDYRSGEKLVLDGGNFTDVQASVDLRFIRGGRDAGLLIRATQPSVGFDAQHGYFAGLIPDQKRVVFGKTDGNSWQEIARAEVDVNKDKTTSLTVNASGSEFRIFLDGKEVLKATDTTYKSGSIGLRVVDTHARFSDLKVSAAE
jgi:GH43 family beta-xylosidase